ncbi:hypothetical protein D9M71_555520 [compost metagenome]
MLDFDAGIVEGIVETSISLDSASEQLLHIGLAGNVTGYEQRLSPCGTDQIDRTLAACSVQIGNHHLQSFGGKCQGRRPADTCRAASDQGNLAGKSHAHR